jgi:hypothetical protein
VRRHRILACVTLVTGFGLAALSQAIAPVAFPLFDGVVVVDPYRYLVPPQGGDGSPTSAASTVPIAEGVSPAFAVYTAENPPQAELLARGGELAIHATSSSVKVTIDPVAAPAANPKVAIAGNVYRFTVTDQAGAALVAVPGQFVTLALRGPAGISASAAIARFANGTWTALPTEPSGLQDLLITNTDAFGDFAILGAVPATVTGANPEVLLAALVAAGLIVLLGLRYAGPLRRRAGTAAKGRPRGHQ